MFSYLYVARPSVEIEVDVLDVSILGKQVRQIFFARFFVDIGGNYNPAFDASDCDRVLEGSRFACGFLGIGRGR